MDKKILLGGAAALLLVGNMYATPASAAIDLSIGGEAKLTGNMSECGPAGGGNITALAIYNGAAGTSVADNGLDTALTALGHEATIDDGDDALNWTGEVGPCAGADRAGVDWGFGKELSIGASGTLANGLEVSFSDKIDLTDVDKEEGSFELVLGSAVGTLTFKDGAPSAVDAVILNKFDVDITGNKVGPGARGRLPTETSGSAGMGILWNAPSVGNLDLYVSWAPNSGNAGLDTADFENTFAVGAVMNTSALTIGAGYEAASANASAACSLGIAAGGLDHTVTSGSIVERSAQSIVSTVYGGSECGDETLAYIGATFSAGDITFNAGYSNLDTDGADTTIYGVAMDTTVGEYDLGLTYRQNEKTYVYDKVKDEQSVLGVSLGTSLGDGVDLGLQFSTNEADLAAEAAGNGKTNNYFAEASLTVGF